MNKKGISLVVLVITIVVIVTLTAAVMTNISKKELVKGANEATIRNNFRTLQEELEAFMAKKGISSKGKFRDSSLSADVNSVIYNTKDSTSTESNIYDILPSLKNTDYAENITIAGGKLVINDLDELSNQYALETIQDVKTTSFGKAYKDTIVKDINATINGLNAKYNNPVIPVGFKAINTTDAKWDDLNNDNCPDGWNDGLVIADKDGNEFVWVPVDGVDVPYSKWCNNGIAYNNSSIIDVPSNELPEGVDKATQITKYGGFYIGRYEAGVPANQTTINSTSPNNSNVSGVPQVKKGIRVWTFIDYTNANFNAQKLYNNSYVKSGLLTGTMWDTTCKWINNAGISVDDSRTYGNHSDPQFPANVSGYGEKQVTGFSEYWKVKNIYDLAGNVWEWINEVTNYSYRIIRGGSYNDDGEYSVSYRFSGKATATYDFRGFRIALYIL